MSVVENPRAAPPRRAPRRAAGGAATGRRSVLPLTAWGFVAPSLLLNLVIVLVPALATVLLSFTSWDGLSSPEFVGLQNYRDLVQDTEFRTALINNIKWVCAYLIIPVGLGFFTALFMSSLRRGGAVLRTLLFLPYILPTVVTAQVWALLLNPISGVNTLLEAAGFEGPLWLADPDMSLWVVMGVDIWRFWGIVLVIMVGSMGKVDPQVVEAALLDGAGRLAIIRHVLVPQLRATLTLILMLCLIWSFTAFDYVYVMTKGGPGNASQILVTYMYKVAFELNSLGYASTLAVCLMVIALGSALAYRMIRRGED